MKERTIELLKESGWYPGRKIEINPFVKGLENKGFEVFDKAKEFIEEFGMLDIYVPSLSIRKDKKIKHTTRIDEVINSTTSRENTREIEEFMEEKMIIVGNIHNYEGHLIISESGRVFTDDGFYADTFTEFWDILLNHEGFKPWEYWL